MTKHDKAMLRRYLRTVGGMLPCPRKQKNRILEDIRRNTDSFLTDHPDAAFSQVQAHFGTPEQIAASYVDDLDTLELLRAMHTRKKVITIAAAAVLVILITWGCAVTWAVIESNNHNNGYFTTTIT